MNTGQISKSHRVNAQGRAQETWEHAEEKGDTHCGGQRARLQEKLAPPAPCRGRRLVCSLPGMRDKASVGSVQATLQKHSKGSQLPPASVVTGGVTQEGGDGESPAVAPAISRPDDLQPEVKNQELLG